MDERNATTNAPVSDRTLLVALARLAVIVGFIFSVLLLGVGLCLCCISADGNGPTTISVGPWKLRTWHVGVASLFVALLAALVTVTPVWRFLARAWKRSQTAPESETSPSDRELPDTQQPEGIIWEQLRRSEERIYLIVIADLMLTLIQQLESIGTEFKEEEDPVKYRQKYRDTLRRLCTRAKNVSQMTWFDVAAREYGGIIKELHRESSNTAGSLDRTWEGLRDFIKGTDNRSTKANTEAHAPGLSSCH